MYMREIRLECRECRELDENLAKNGRKGVFQNDMYNQDKASHDRT